MHTNACMRHETGCQLGSWQLPVCFATSTLPSALIRGNHDQRTAALADKSVSSEESTCAESGTRIRLWSARYPCEDRPRNRRDRAAVLRKRQAVTTGRQSTYLGDACMHTLQPVQEIGYHRFDSREESLLIRDLVRMQFQDEDSLDGYKE